MNTIGKRDEQHSKNTNFEKKIRYKNEIKTMQNEAFLLTITIGQNRGKNGCT